MPSPNTSSKYTDPSMTVLPESFFSLANALLTPTTHSPCGHVKMPARLFFSFSDCRYSSSISRTHLSSSVTCAFVSLA